MAWFGMPPMGSWQPTMQGSQCSLHAYPSTQQDYANFTPSIGHNALEWSAGTFLSEPYNPVCVAQLAAKGIHYQPGGFVVGGQASGSSTATQTQVAAIAAMAQVGTMVKSVPAASGRKSPPKLAG
jgi:hypothetical protein